ncbi:EAL domain-containing protein [Bacillus sp. 31A1R]|uniref:EAL domain-containing protein n=1 Tax=Robertmurraya mangrovi TaxID=3098077 RepID=A0ABU5IYD8_9BACI|nr:EAL domain-containing protein [Bacillus sp. 31A1R]MDZ5472126.1 EAL domain-containing protein [Bacillus sp. 31A1R]
MAHHVEKIRRVFRWGKILLPLKKLQYYPPKFIIRDPVYQGVKRAFKEGHEVAIIVFNIQNLRQVYEQLGEHYYQQFVVALKVQFQRTILNNIPQQDVITLHDYYSDGLTLFIKVGHDRNSVSEIEALMLNVLEESNKNLNIEFPMAKPDFVSGYMFIEKKHYSIQEAVYKAHQQALAMAEKRVQSEFNDMLYTVSKIVSQRNIYLLAQPIIDVATKEVKAWEMLTRGPKGTFLESPLRLFSVARQTGMLYDLERIVLEKTLEQIHTTGCSQDVFINFTPLTLGNQRFIKDVRKLMEKYKNIPPRQITIEITERDSIEGIEYFIYNIKILRNLGFRVAVDDTGAGYASLNTISSIMPDIIKIDRSVIQDIDKNSVKESMLKGLLLVANETGSLVVAEGIESEEEALVLSRNQVHLAQGYYFAKPDTLKKGLASS